MAEQDAPPALVADVLTVVSELVSNARRHAGGITGFQVTVRADQVIVKVSDRSALLPHLRPPSAHTPGGFGWRVVKTLAPNTFVRSHPSGKTIIATLPTRKPTAAAYLDPGVVVGAAARAAPGGLSAGRNTGR
ncbi:ATP-binding protein [Streptomyces virginiae]|uniref:ATP-binding protein n=1 Tax=Streptomyces virginiae TaxID=1961 RepID=UPI00344934B9